MKSLARDGDRAARRPSGAPGVAWSLMPPNLPPPADTNPPLRTPAPDAPVHGAGRRRDLWLAVGWKLAVMPGLAVVVGLAAGLSGGQLLAPVVTAALPTAQNVFMYASRYGAAKDLARDAVLLTTAGFVPVVLLAAALLH